MDLFTQIFGLIGCLMVSVPFLLGTSIGKAEWHPSTWRFILTNLAGACILLISLFYHFNLGSFVIELFWITGGCISVYKKFKGQ